MRVIVCAGALALLAAAPGQAQVVGGGGAPPTGGGGALPGVGAQAYAPGQGPTGAGSWNGGNWNGYTPAFGPLWNGYYGGGGGYGGGVATGGGPKLETDNPYVQEHVDLIKAIPNNEKLNEGWHAAVSSMTAVLGRMASYSGDVVSWDDAVANGPNEAPETIAWDAKPKSLPDDKGWALRQYTRVDPQAVRQFVAATPLHPLSAREALKWLEKRKNKES